MSMEVFGAVYTKTQWAFCFLLFGLFGGAVLGSLLEFNGGIGTE